MFKYVKFLMVFALVGLFWGPAPARASEGDPILRIDSGGHKAKVQELMFTNDSRYLVSASDDKTVRVWDLDTGRTVRTIRGQIGGRSVGKIYCAALSPDNKLLATGGWMTGGEESGHHVRLHDFRTGEIVALLYGNNNVVHTVAFSPDGRYLATGGHDKTVRIFNIREKRQVAVMEGHTAPVYKVVFSPDGARLVSASDDSDVRMWSVPDGRLLAHMQGHQNVTRAVAWSPDGRYIVSGAADYLIKLWDGRDGSFIKDLVKLATVPRSLTFTPDGTRILTGRYLGPKECYVYEVPSGKKLVTFRKNDNTVPATAVSPDGRLAATGGSNKQEIFVWELDNGQVVQRLAGNGARVVALGISRDGQEIAFGNHYNFTDNNNRGPLQQIIRLKEGQEWGVALGGEVREASRFLRAQDSAGPYRLKAIKSGRNREYYDTLQIFKNGKVIHEIVRENSTGNRHICYGFTDSQGKTLVSGGSFGHLTAYDTATGDKLTDFIGHEGDVWALTISYDGRFLVSGSDDQTIRIWDLSNLGRESKTYPLLSIFVGTDNEWVAWTSKGYYTCSLKGDRLIGWQIDYGPDRQSDFYTVDRFAATFYRPDVVAAALAAGSETEGIKQVSQTRQTAEQVDLRGLLPPTVFFVEPDSEYIESTQPTIQIKARAKSVTGDPITEFKLLVNGRPMAERGITVSPRQDDRLELVLESDVQLQPGENTITLLASSRQAQSNPETIKVVYTAEAQPAVEQYKPNLYLLAIGVSQYKDPSLNLDFAHKDAQDLVAIMSRQAHSGLYGEVKTRLLINDQATRGEILDALDWLIRESTQKDVAIVFLAGHGMNDELGGYYFLAHDSDPTRLRRTGVKWSDFQDVLTSIPSKIILLADTCHSGNVTGSHRKTRSALDMTAALKELVSAGTGVVVMTAATGREASQESPEWNNGAFTRALVEGLGGQADHDKNKMIDIKELDFFITYRVKELTGGTQHPTTEIPASLPNFPLALK